MDDTYRWQNMASAPRDGSLILVTMRPSEQRPAEVDVSYWARADAFGIKSWCIEDSYPSCIIGYADPELKFWMPLPTANLSKNSPEIPTPWERKDDEQLGGSGI